jgi:hypothetical protein
MKTSLTMPGIYAVSDSGYLHDPVIVPSLNRTIAKVLCELSPAHARAAHPRLNDTVTTKHSEEMDVGTAAHATFLRGEKVVELVDVDDWRTKAARETRDAIRAEGRVPLKRENYGAVQSIVERLRQFRDETGAFTDGKPERTIVWQEGSIWCRVKPDWLPDEPSASLWDLKVTDGHATLVAFTRTLYATGGDIQASFYPRGAECVRGEPPDGMKFCVIEAHPPHGIKVFQLTPVALEIANSKVRYAIERWTWAMEFGEWPSYDVAPEWIDPPGWAMREWEGLMLARSTSPRLRWNDEGAQRFIDARQFGG